VKAVVIYKIADDFQSIAIAARRFLDQEDQMDIKVHRVFAGHLRSIIGDMTDAKRVKLEAEAASTRTKQLGEAQAAATRATGIAQGEATRAKGLAEAEAIRARAAALAENHEALIGQQVAEELREIVGEASKAFASIGNMTVLNGAEGVGEVFRQVVGVGVAAIPMLRGALERTDGVGNGATTRKGKEDEPRAPAR
jgi:uncharacterized membrane protein YqiK